MSIYQTLKNKQLESRKNKEKETSIIIGGIISDVTPIGNDSFEITDDLIIKTLNKFIKGVDTNIELAEKSNRTDLIEKYKNEKKVYESFLPKQMKEEEIKLVIETFIHGKEKSMKLMGDIMKNFNNEYSGQFNPAILSKIVKEMLS